ncbi:MAG: TlpA disulfide reductase family protein [Fulvivirga sp.]|uniref:TlpA family protein disulfide reductase n=1 Tax=Fulvivirga sp. TaxID=1931237 RepID=UPI0032F09BA1
MFNVYLIVKEKIIKEMKSWGVILVIFLGLYLTGLHTEVAALAQRAILTTGLISADTETDSDTEQKVDYNFKLKNLNGETVSLDDYKGKVIFLNIWATWCAPCIAEMPNIQSLYDKIDKDKIAFVMLSMDNSEAKAKKFIDKKGFTFPTFMAASDVPDLFRVPSIPTTFVISKDGKVASKNIGMANYDKKKFREFLEELAEK